MGHIHVQMWDCSHLASLNILSHWQVVVGLNQCWQDSIHCCLCPLILSDNRQWLCLLSIRGHDALPPRESGASSRDDSCGGAEGAAGHCQEDAALLFDLSAGTAGGWRKDHRARGRNCRILVCFRCHQLLGLIVSIFLSSAELKRK